MLHPDKSGFTITINCLSLRGLRFIRRTKQSRFIKDINSILNERSKTHYILINNIKDKTMAHDGKLKLLLRDVYSGPILGRLDIRLEHNHTPSASFEKRDVRAARQITIKEMTDGVYTLSLFPTLYRSVKRIIMINSGETTRELFILPLNPDRVSKIAAPAFSDLTPELKAVLRRSKIEAHPNLAGEALYNVLDDIRKAGLLNIAAKMQATRLPSGRDVLSAVGSISRIRGDRFFATVAVDLRDDVKNAATAGTFHEAPNMDHDPPMGYVKAGSFKTNDQYGNLQLTFFMKEDAVDFMVDADIDDAAGLTHSLQVIDHYLTGSGTHPYDIHEILLAHQKLDPGYQLLVA